MSALPGVDFSVQDSPPPPVESCADYSRWMSPTVEGRSVDILTPVLEEPWGPYADAMAMFESCTGIDVVYHYAELFDIVPSLRRQTSSGGLVTDAVVWVYVRDVQDLLAGVAGGPVPLSPSAVADVRSNWLPAFTSPVSVAGVPYAVPLTAEVKSLVWYSPSFFARHSLAPPSTWGEMMDLASRARDLGVVPFCGGLHDDHPIATDGWPASDWLEHLVLAQGAGVYDDWVAGRLPFDSPQVRHALGVLRSWMGKAPGVVSMSPAEAVAEVRDGRCMMAPLPSFMNVESEESSRGGYFPPVFPFPLPSPSGGPVSVVTASYAAPLDGSPEVTAFMDFLASPLFVSRMAYWGNVRGSSDSGVYKARAWLSASRLVGPDAYPGYPLYRLYARVLSDPSVVLRYDASDVFGRAFTNEVLLPKLADWFSGVVDDEKLLPALDAALRSSSESPGG